ncbi:Predicted ATP-binding protein involved in virulence [Flexibacter flexilis DSM 6793]|uniref:Predicted ATP-binding protein involved in virulence n=1 Tax=Flexibacter flexilis DSM 6793 TaxID=927664 RepID=A0A1I1G354_9BACT|nr:ATP-binding protein [Flexibacter flexilis]SFC05726.1 Predicted ATP-binding protein involved in virulence [Flexibacter flexilis DSM 6793]
MEEIFIEKIEIKELLNIKDFSIALSDTERKHLIITGKNGSGKTTFLNELKKYLEATIHERLLQKIQSVNNELEELYKNNLDLSKIHPAYVELEANTENERREKIIIKEIYRLEGLKELYDKKYKVDILFKNSLSITEYFQKGKCVFSFFGAKRGNNLNSPSGIKIIDLKPVYKINESAGNNFLQYIVNMKADRAFANDANETKVVQKIDKWFSHFTDNLFQLLSLDNAKLQFDRKTYNFNIIEENQKTYNLNQLSDGYSAILNIITELIMRMEKHHAKAYDIQGIVLIDEIETHLHIELQKKILPFLTSFFPKIQFIVTTHSPFVLNSVENAVICDLEKRIVTTDLSGYSYDAIVESYFDSDKYSAELKNKISEYEALSEKENLTEDEEDRLYFLKRYLKEIPKFYSEELAVKLQQIELKNLKKK